MFDECDELDEFREFNNTRNEIKHLVINEPADEIKHYGVARRSGRYPWGSGGNEDLPDSASFLDYVKRLIGLGMTETQVAEGLGVTTKELRAYKTIANAEKRAANVAMATRLKDKGYSNRAIAERMGLKGESSVRNLLASVEADKADVLKTTSDLLRDNVNEKGFIDVGVGVSNQLNISSTKLTTALELLRAEGYEVHTIKIDQLGTGLKTELKVLAPPGTTQKEVWMNRSDIRQIQEFSQDGGRSYLGLHPPLSVDSKRIGIRYAEDGGTDADGTIYVRPGVEDISLDGNRYAQVRIAVDGSHYLKGMAIYKDDLPDGVDLVFNTNKSNTGNKLDAMKKMSDDPDNPFGSSVKRQIIAVDKDGNERVTSAMNILYEEGDWDRWSKTLSSQMLSKQSRTLAKQQLDSLHDNFTTDFEDIMGMTNPVVRQKMLLEFAESADSAAVHLKAAALPRQSSHVIIPVGSLKDNEVYAQNFRNGERVALIRFPHGGTFEIPELVVNNNRPEAKKLLGDAKDAIGINSKVAERLSGADFDGDTVLVIPNNEGRISTSPPLKQLKNFDPKAMYKLPPDSPIKRMSGRQKQDEMGKISNLITDMTILGASQDELARAVRHSMVVIDAEKHELNYKQSAIDNGIADLKKKYLGGANKGATTLISRARSPLYIDKIKPRPAKEGGPIDPKTGKLVFVPGGPGKSKVPKLSLVEDANELSAGTPMEKIYAHHSNRMKAMANQARKEAVHTKYTPYSPAAKVAYKQEVASLNAKLNRAMKNKPRERQAQLVAGAVYAAKKRANPDMTREEQRKIKGQALTEARIRVGAKKDQIEITPSEWAAIQAGAITTNKLNDILSNANMDKVKALALPRTQKLMTSSKLTRARNLAKSGYTRAQIADALGVSLTTLKNSLDGGE